MILARWILFIGLVWMGGCVTVRWLLAASGDDSRLQRRLAGLGLLATAVTFAALLGLGVLQLLEFRDPFAPLHSEAALLFLRTSWGHAWIGAAVGLGAVVAALGLVRGRAGGSTAGEEGRVEGAEVPVGDAGNPTSAPWLLATVLAMALAFFPAFTGHAVGTEDLAAMAVLADGVHVLAAGAWIGSLGVMMVLVVPSRARSRREELLPSLLARFSATALASAGALAVTGIFASWLHLPSVSALSGSAYGRLLLLKLVLVGVVLVLGFRNWRRWRRSLRNRGVPEVDRGPILVELVTAHLVLAVTAVLVGTAPPVGP
ncbi:MAG: CopD family protein [Longimicrobiales bacterium]